MVYWHVSTIDKQIRAQIIYTVVHPLILSCFTNINLKHIDPEKKKITIAIFADENSNIYLKNKRIGMQICHFLQVASERDQRSKGFS